MGSTAKAITKVYYNNSTTPTTVALTVDSEIVNQPVLITGNNKAVEVADDRYINPGVIGGQAHSN
jgi:hypothetical protein